MTTSWSGAAAALGTSCVVLLGTTASPLRADASAQESPRIDLPPADAVMAEALTSIRSMRELSDGRVLVTDRTEQRLLLVDFETGDVAQVGGRGQGPGEYSRPGAMYPLVGDSTLLIDFTSSRRFLLDGPEIVETRAARRSLRERFGIEVVGSAGAGRLLGLRAHRTSGLAPILRADSLAVVLLDEWPAESGEEEPELDTLAIIAGQGNRGECFGAVRADGTSGRMGPCSPISAGDWARSFPDGWTAIVYRDPYRVDWRAPDGGWVRGEALPGGSRLLDSDAERCLAVRGYPFRGIEEPCDASDFADREWPAEVPPFVSLTSRSTSAPMTRTVFAASDGRLIVRRVPTIEALTTENRYDVFDRAGRLAGIVVLPANEAIVGFGDGTVYTVETDEVDLQRLRRHPWP